MAPQWLEAGALRLAVQRIGREHWHADPPLRSWGVAPLHLHQGRLMVPCFEGEALWLGAWLEAGGITARLQLEDPATGAAGSIALPGQDQLVALRRGAADPGPIDRGVADRRPLSLRLALDGLEWPMDLVLLTPEAWQSLSGRAAPPPRSTPPPLPPRLG